MLLLTHINCSKKEWPLYVHSHLLDGRSLKTGHLFHTRVLKPGNFEWDDIEVLTIKVDLVSRRALTLWSGWLYGQPMWSPTICTDIDPDLDYSDVDRDLECIVDIYQLCGGLKGDVGKDYDGVNACLDAFRAILLHETYVPSNLLAILGVEFEGDPTAIRMLAELLVYGKCASDGRTQRWLQEAEETDLADFSEALHSIGLEFAKKLMGGESPDLTARCAYHIHPQGEGCDVARAGEISSGECILQRQVVDAH
jgi:hypothetical protein